MNNNLKKRYLILVAMAVTLLVVVLFYSLSTKPKPWPKSPPLAERMLIKQERGPSSSNPEVEVLRVTFGETVLEIPTKYGAFGLDSRLPVLDITLVWPSFSRKRTSPEDKYTFTIFIEADPKYGLPPSSQVFPVEQQLIQSGYKLKHSNEFPVLSEWKHPNYRPSNFVIRNSQPSVISTEISCLSGFREDIEIAEKPPLQMGNRSCRVYGRISETTVLQIRFDARLLPEAHDFQRKVGKLIESFIKEN